MKVIIVGCGRIGFMVARSFIDQGCTDVSIVSQSPVDELIEAFEMNAKAIGSYSDFIDLKECFYPKDYPDYPRPSNDPFFTLLFSASIEKKRRYFTHRRN